MPRAPIDGKFGAGPRNESELLQHRPTCHVDGAFPRPLLIAGERVLFEGRPAYLHYRRWSVAVLGALLLLTALFTVALIALPPAPGTAPTPPGVALGVGAFFAVIWASLIALSVWRWRRAAFALTQQRVLWIEGAFAPRFRFAEWGSVARLERPQGSSGDLRFDVVRAQPGAPTERPARETLVWPSVPLAPRVYDYVQSAFALQEFHEQARMRSRAIRERMLEGRTVCAYCGSLVEFPTDSGGSRRCPSCTAPLELRVVARTTLDRPEIPEEHGYVARARPAIHHAYAALDWYRAFGLLWAGFVLAAGVTLLLAGHGGDPAGVLPVAFLAAVLGVGFYVAWYYAARRWRSATDTLVRSLPADSTWSTAVARPARRLATIAWVGVVASLALLGLLAAWFAWFASHDAASAAPPTGLVLPAELTVVAYVGACLTSQVAWLLSVPRLLAGAEVPAIETRLRRGVLLAWAGAAVGGAPVILLLLSFVAAPTAPPPAYPALLGVAGPVLTVLAASDFRSAYGTWSALAGRLAGPVPGATGAYPTPSRALTAEMIAATGSRGFQARPIALVAVAGIVIVASIAGAAWYLGPHPTGSAAAGATSSPTPPVVVIQVGGVWTVPADHYTAHEFSVNRSASLDANFTASSDVVVLVLDSNDYATWTLVGHAYSYGADTGNVSAAFVHAQLYGPERWYLVVANYNDTSSVGVTWTSGCEIQF